MDMANQPTQHLKTKPTTTKTIKYLRTIVVWRNPRLNDRSVKDKDEEREKRMRWSRVC